MKDTVFEIGDEVVLKNKPELGSWTIEDEYRDREGNTLFELVQEALAVEDNRVVEEGVYPEALISLDEYNEQVHSLANPSLEFPSFKSYGLTRKQVWEVMNNYANYMIGLLHDLEDEAIGDGNEEFAKSFSDDKRVFYDLKLMSDRLWHRFVEGD